MPSPTSTATKTIYTCPMHPQIKQDQPGTCPKCGGMELVPQQVAIDTPLSTTPSLLATYAPLFIIAALLILIASLASLYQAVNQSFQWEAFFRYGMAGFFLVFSLLKLIDIAGFAEGFATYDLLAKRWPKYGFIYPYLELSLGLLYLFNIAPLLTNLATVIIMGLASIGVAQALSKKQKFQCACLGTVLKVPLSKVTFIEDIIMVAMAATHTILIVTAGQSHNVHPSTSSPTWHIALLALLSLVSLVSLLYIQRRQVLAVASH